MLDEWVSSSAINAINEESHDISDDKIFTLDVLAQNAARGHGLITSVAAANNVLAVGTNRGWIVRHDFGGGDIELDLSTSRDQSVHKVFLDPSGRHCLVAVRSSTSVSTFYLHAKWKKARLVPVLKDVLVNTIAWNRSQLSEGSTGEMILGTSAGEVYKMIIDEKDKKDKCTRLFKLTELTEPFVSIQVESISSNTGTRYFIMAVTPRKLFVFVGSGSLESVFETYSDRPVKFTELPGELPKSELHFYGRRYAESFAWLAGPGIYHGTLHISTQLSEDTIIVSKKLLEYSRIHEDTQPSALSMTEYHFLLLYGGRLKAVNRISEKLVEEDSFAVHDMDTSSMLGLCADYAAAAYYAYNSTSVFEITVREEDRHMWKIYLGMKEYAAALEYCKNSTQRDHVFKAQAEDAFDREDYMAAASYYAKINAVISFEEVTLKFWNMKELEALRTYLLRKLDSLGGGERSQITMIATWLTELYLNKINELAMQTNGEGEYTALLREFRAFLSDSKDFLDKSTTLKLLESYGRNEEYVYFAGLKNQYKTVINHYIQQKDAKKALAVLKTGNVPIDLQYKFAPALIMLEPNETVEFWMSRQELNTQNMIPALMRYSSIPRSREEPHHAIKYLEFCVQRLKSEDRTIHNLLVLLLAKRRDEKALLRYLQAKYGKEQLGKPDVFYDPNYALRVCLDENLSEASVFLYSMMGMHEEAVSLALKVDVDLAKIEADKVEEDEELRKKLWLLIAKHVIKEEKGLKRENIKKAVAFVNETQGLLKIEDILPFFPEFTLINDFQEAIYISLQEYNSRIEELKLEMHEDMLSAERLRKDINALPQRFNVLDPDEQCEICNRKLFVLDSVHGPTTQFYAFPCTHCFHTECLISYILQNGGKEERDRIMELKKKLSILFVEKPAVNGPMARSNEDGLEEDDPINEVNAQMAETVASECPYCGMRAVRQVFKPFISPEESELERLFEIGVHWYRG